MKLVADIGLCIVTYNRGKLLYKLLKSLPTDQTFKIVLVNDGKDSISEAKSIRKDIHIIHHKINKGVGISKNDGMHYLLKDSNIKHIFVIEDDIYIKDKNVFTKYIEASKETGIPHFNYGLQGFNNIKSNKQTPKPRKIISYKNYQIALYKHPVGSFSYFSRTLLEDVGLHNPKYFNALEHVSLTYNIIKKKHHPPFGWFVDLKNSHKLLGSISWTTSTSTIWNRINCDDIQNKAHQIFLQEHEILAPKIKDISFKNVWLSLKQLDKNNNLSLFNNLLAFVFDGTLCPPCLRPSILKQNFSKSIIKRKIKNFLKNPFDKPLLFKESKIVHKYLDGLHGIEIRAATHNSFGLDKTGGYLNVDYTFNHRTERWSSNKYLTAKVNIVSLGDDLPFKSNSMDYVVSSHVIEHFFDPIKAIKEWLRVVKKNGFIVMIVPHKDRTFDKYKPETSVKELLQRHREEINIRDYVQMKGYNNPLIAEFIERKLILKDKIPQGSVRIKTDNHPHWSIWTTKGFLKLCKELKFNVVEYQDIDDKVGNGFTIIINKK